MKNLSCKVSHNTLNIVNAMSKFFSADYCEGKIKNLILHRKLTVDYIVERLKQISTCITLTAFGLHESLWKATHIPAPGFTAMRGFLYSYT